MATVDYRYGALYVAEDAQDHRVIDQALKRLDSRLFLERQCTIDNEFVWTVNLDVGDQVPVWVLDWRDSDEQAIELPTFGIVEEVKRMMQRGPVSNEDHRRRNAELRARRRREFDEAVAEIAREHIRAHTVKSFTFFDRQRPVNHARHARREQRLRDSDRLVA